MEIIRISVVGIAGVLLAVLLKQVRPEYALYLALTAGLIILYYSSEKLNGLFGDLREIQKMLPLNTTYLQILMKMLGITYVGQFCSGICRDAGYASVAGQIETFGKLAVLAVSMPALKALLETIHDFLGLV